MDENLTRGYCHQQRRESSKVEIVTQVPATSKGRQLCCRSQTLPPLDNHRLIYFSLVLCGVGFLLPYNNFIIAVDYYQQRHPATTIVFDISVVYIGAAFFGVVVNSILVETLSLRIRITFGYLLSLATLAVVATSDVWLDLFDVTDSYHVTLFAVATVALGCTVQQSSFYGFTSMLPSSYTQAIMTGESAAGLIVSVSRILTKILLNDVRQSTMFFFAVTMVILIGCCIAFHLTMRTDFVRFHVGLCSTALSADDQRWLTASFDDVEGIDGKIIQDGNRILLIQSPTSLNNNGSGYKEKSEPEDVQRQSHNATQTCAVTVLLRSNGMKELESVVASVHRRNVTTWQAIKSGCVARCEVFRSVWPFLISISVTYFVTLSLFPGIESEVISCLLRTWMPVLLIFFFNLFDFIGKIVASVHFDWPPRHLVLCTLSRVILIPLMLICAGSRGQTGGMGVREIWPVLLSAVLGITNGYFGSASMILAPTRVPDEQKELTGNIMTVSYSLGLTTGSALAYLLNTLIGPRVSRDLCAAAVAMSLNSTLSANPTDAISDPLGHQSDTFVATTMAY